MKIIDRVLGVQTVTPLGTFLAGAYQTENAGRRADHLLLYIGLESRPCNLRINSACYTSDIFGDQRCDCNWQLRFSLQYIVERRQGIIIYHMHHEGRANGIVNKLRSYDAAARFGIEGRRAYEGVGALADGRRYRSSVAILADLGIQEVALISNNPHKQAALEEHGIHVMKMIPAISDDPRLADYYDWKRRHFRHVV
jgi:3,4-dihydroxy 2-butanone 4-phosphate synthase/GTP cyclohydrolase II